MTRDDRDRVHVWLSEGHGAKLTPLDRMVLVTLAEKAHGHTSRCYDPCLHHEGDSFPGVEAVAGMWGVRVRSVERSIARLHSLGLVSTRLPGVGKWRARYVLTGEVARPEGHPNSPTRGSPNSEAVARPTGRSSPTAGSRLPDRRVRIARPKGHPYEKHENDSDNAAARRTASAVDAAAADDSAGQSGESGATSASHEVPPDGERCYFCGEPFPDDLAAVGDAEWEVKPRMHDGHWIHRGCVYRMRDLERRLAQPAMDAAAAGGNPYADPPPDIETSTPTWPLPVDPNIIDDDREGT